VNEQGLLRELARLCDGERIQSVTGDSIPSGPGAPYPGEHLYVNCLYGPKVARLNVGEVLTAARNDTLRVLQALAGKPCLGRFRSVWIRFFLPRGVLGGQEWVPRGSCRVYAYSLLREGFQADVAQIDAAYLLSNKFFQESSEVDRIQELIEVERGSKRGRSY